jgi:methylmalonyl-CoA mutase
MREMSTAGMLKFAKAATVFSATEVSALSAMRLAAPFEDLRAAALRAGPPPEIFLATLGPLAEFSARADFARNLFAAGGLCTAEAPAPPQSINEGVAAFRASGARLACLCAADARYAETAAQFAAALKNAGAICVFLAGKFEAPDVDVRVFNGCDIVHALARAHAELGLSA